MRSSWGHTLHPPDTWAPHETGVERVPVLAMADVLRDAVAAKDVDARLLVKINTEGEECETVLGTPVESWKAVDELVVETHPWTTCTAEDLAGYLALGRPHEGREPARADAAAAASSASIRST